MRFPTPFVSFTSFTTFVAFVSFACTYTAPTHVSIQVIYICGARYLVQVLGGAKTWSKKIVDVAWRIVACVTVFIVADLVCEWRRIASSVGVWG